MHAYLQLSPDHLCQIHVYIYVYIYMHAYLQLSPEHLCQIHVYIYVYIYMHAYLQLSPEHLCQIRDKLQRHDKWTESLLHTQAHVAGQVCLSFFCCLFVHL